MYAVLVLPFADADFSSATVTATLDDAATGVVVYPLARNIGDSTLVFELIDFPGYGCASWPKLNLPNVSVSLLPV